MWSRDVTTPLRDPPPHTHTQKAPLILFRCGNKIQRGVDFAPHVPSTVSSFCISVHSSHSEGFSDVVLNPSQKGQRCVMVTTLRPPCTATREAKQTCTRKTHCGNRTVHIAGSKHYTKQQASEWDLALFFRIMRQALLPVWMTPERHHKTLSSSQGYGKPVGRGLCS